VVVVTATALTWFEASGWVIRLGRLAATRGAAALVGIVASAAIGLVVDTPDRALRISAWFGTGLVVMAMGFAMGLRVGPARAFRATEEPRSRIAPGPHLLTHVAAQASQAGLLVLAPALGFLAGSQTISFLAPAAAIAGMAIGHLVVAQHVQSSRLVRSALLASLVAGGLLVPFKATVLLGLSFTGLAVGAAVPGAQSRLLQRIVGSGASDFAANAYASRGAIAGQIAGPVTGYLALGIHSVAASAGVAAFGWGGLHRPARRSATRRRSSRRE